MAIRMFDFQANMKTDSNSKHVLSANKANRALHEFRKVLDTFQSLQKQQAVSNDALEQEVDMQVSAEAAAVPKATAQIETELSEQSQSDFLDVEPAVERDERLEQVAVGEMEQPSNMVPFGFVELAPVAKQTLSEIVHIANQIHAALNGETELQPKQLLALLTKLMKLMQKHAEWLETHPQLKAIPTAQLMVVINQFLSNNEEEFLQTLQKLLGKLLEASTAKPAEQQTQQPAVSVKSPLQSANSSSQHVADATAADAVSTTTNKQPTSTTTPVAIANQANTANPANDVSAPTQATVVPTATSEETPKASEQNTVTAAKQSTVVTPSNLKHAESVIANTEVQKQSETIAAPVLKASEEQQLVSSTQSTNASNTLITKASAATVFTPQQIPEELQKMMKNFRFNRLNGTSEARFALNPENLGHVNVKISVSNGQVVAQIYTDTAMAKESLEAQLLHLRAALQSSGLVVERLEISTNTMLSQQFHEQRQKQQSQQSKHGKQRDNEFVNLDAEMKVLEEQQQARKAVLGTTFDVTA